MTGWALAISYHDFPHQMLTQGLPKTTINDAHRIIQASSSPQNIHFEPFLPLTPWELEKGFKMYVSNYIKLPR